MKDKCFIHHTTDKAVLIRRIFDENVVVIQTKQYATWCPKVCIEYYVIGEKEDPLYDNVKREIYKFSFVEWFNPTWKSYNEFLNYDETFRETNLQRLKNQAIEGITLLTFKDLCKTIGLTTKAILRGVKKCITCRLLLEDNYMYPICPICIESFNLDITTLKPMIIVKKEDLIIIGDKKEILKDRKNLKEKKSLVEFLL